MYVLFEGIDGVGKTTQIELLKKEFPNALFSKEPGGSELGKEIRRFILNCNLSSRAKLFLFLADRAEHIQKVVKPNLNRPVFSDRGFISGVAYAFAKDTLSLKELCKLNNLAMEGIYPNGVIFLEISKTCLKERLKKKKLDRIEREGIEYLLKVQKIMRRVLKTLPLPTLFLDASLPKEELHQHILKFLEGVLK